MAITQLPLLNDINVCHRLKAMKFSTDVERDKSNSIKSHVVAMMNCQAYGVISSDEVETKQQSVHINDPTVVYEEI